MTDNTLTGTSLAMPRPMFVRPASVLLVAAASFMFCARAAAQAPNPSPDPQAQAPAASPDPQPQAPAPSPETTPPTRVPTVELDQAVVNVPTTMPLPRHKSYFRITHRFTRDLRRGSLGQLAEDGLGLDNGAI